MTLQQRRFARLLTSLAPNRMPHFELQPEDIRQALEFAARNLDDSVLPMETA